MHPRPPLKYTHHVKLKKIYFFFRYLTQNCSEPSLTNVTNCNASNNTDITTITLDHTKVGVLTTIIVLTVLGNVAVIAAICGRRAKMTRMYYFILHLSLADLLTAFLTLLPELAWTLTFPHFLGGVVMCKLVKFVQMMGPYLSSYVLIMTAVDRYQAICNPLGSCTWTPKRSQVCTHSHITFKLAEVFQTFVLALNSKLVCSNLYILIWLSLLVYCSSSRESCRF
jgi:hypothetical protein